MPVGRFVAAKGQGRDSYGTILPTVEEVRFALRGQTASSRGKRVRAAVVLATAVGLAVGVVKTLDHTAASPSLVAVDGLAAAAPATTMPLLELPSDRDASNLTRALYSTLYALSFNSSAFVFGHEHDNFQGQKFLDGSGVEFESDVFTAVGAYPVLNGFNLMHVIDNQENNATDFSTHIKSTYLMGGFTQLMWDSLNPVTGTSVHNCSGKPIKELLPGGSGNAQWTAWLDKIATFVKRLKNVDGEAIPVVFRLFHEMTGTWFWWSTKCATADEYIAAWQYTVQYLRNDKGVHNLIFHFCPSDPSKSSGEAFDEYWPGDAYVDMVGFDKYSTASTYRSEVAADCAATMPFAASKNIPFAIGETGIAGGVNGSGTPQTFFQGTMMKTLNEDCGTSAYALTWANYNTAHYWTPLSGDKTFWGFRKMMLSPGVMSRASDEYRSISTSTGYATNEALDTSYYPGYWEAEGIELPGWLAST